MPTLNLDAAFTFTSTNQAQHVVVEVVTFSGRHIGYPVKVKADGTRQNYSIPLAVNSQYAGAMKQILLYMPKAKGSARLYKVHGVPGKKVQ
jgi:hypothetical protein